MDDLLITCNDSIKISRLKFALQKEFKMIDLDEVNQYLGVKIHRKHNGIYVCQKGYLQATQNI